MNHLQEHRIQQVKEDNFSMPFENYHHLTLQFPLLLQTYYLPTKLETIIEETLFVNQKESNLE